MAIGVGGCVKPEPVHAKIIRTYRTGIALRKAMTVIELDSGERWEVRGKLGKQGEEITIDPRALHLRR